MTGRVATQGSRACRPAGTNVLHGAGGCHVGRRGKQSFGRAVGDGSIYVSGVERVLLIMVCDGKFSDGLVSALSNGWV